MKFITSRENALFKQLKKLVESARERRKTGRTLLDGTHLLEAYLATGQKPEHVIVNQDSIENAEIRALLRAIPDDRLVELPQTMFTELSPMETPTGVLAVIAIPHFRKPAVMDFCLFLEDVQDPGNLGTVLRSAAAAGMHAAYLSIHCADAWSPKVLRAGMGAHFILPIEERVNLAEKTVTFSGITLATSLGATQSIYDLDLTGPVALLIGNEGSGLSAELLSSANTQAHIPMPGKVESLNAAAAASVCMFERVRQVSHKIAC